MQLDSQRTPDAVPERDLVRFFNRLLITLEKQYGVKRLGGLLAEMRSATQETESFPPGAIRCCKRLGLYSEGAGESFPAFFVPFVARLAEAVSRTPSYVGMLFGLLSDGEANGDFRPVCGATPRCLDCDLTKECDYYNQPRQPWTATLSPARRLTSGHEDVVSDVELLTILLSGDKPDGETAAKALVARYGGLRTLFKAEPREFSGMRDMAGSWPLRLTAASALYRRLLRERREEVLQITSAKDLFDRYGSELRDYRQETVVLVLMDHGNRIMRDVWFSDGTVNMAKLSIAELMRSAIKESAVHVALVHNHPSGDQRPSTADLDFTRRFTSACSIFDVIMIDHVVVAEDKYFSLADNGLMAF